MKPLISTVPQSSDLVLRNLFEIFLELISNRLLRRPGSSVFLHPLACATMKKGFLEKWKLLSGWKRLA
jgi:hypothetical protein